MFDRLDDMLRHYEELMLELNNPSVAEDQRRFRKLMKEQADLAPIVDAYKQYKQAKQDVEDSLALLDEESDEEMKELAKEELADAKKRIEELEQELKILLLPKDPNDEKNVIVEIRAGAGGDEAALFASELYRMYVHYAESQHWKHEGSRVHDHRSWRVLQVKIRERCSPCAACPGDRVRRKNPYVHCDGCNHAGGRGVRCCDR